jgi:transcription elongation factor GreB
MPKLTVVAEVPPTRDRVYFGAWVTLEDEAGVETVRRIVGSDEADGARGEISVDSPLARALLGRAPDDEIAVRTAEREMRYLVIDVRYTA